MNEEEIKVFEKRLSKHMLKRRMITAALMIAFLVIGIVFFIRHLIKQKKKK